MRKLLEATSALGRTALETQWGGFLRSLLERILKPSTRPAAWSYLVVIGMFGGAGLWVTFVLASIGKASSWELVLGIGTYGIAIIATSFGDLMLDRQASGTLRLFLYIAGALGLVLSGYYAWGSVYQAGIEDGKSVSLVVLLQCVAPIWATWWLVNGMDDRFVEPPAPTAAIGGAPGQPL